MMAGDIYGANNYYNQYYQQTHHYLPNQYINPYDYQYDTYKKHYNYGQQFDPHEVAIKNVIGKLVTELKQILKKDFNKRMIENTAFKTFETWWDEQERRSKNVTENKVPIVSAATTSNSVHSELLEKKENVRDNFDKVDYGGFGLGLRASIPKLPSFRRIPKRPSPKTLDEDSRKSDPDDDMVQGSDSEKEDIQQSSKTAYSRPLPSESSAPPAVITKRKGSTSSFTTSSSDDSSSEEEEEESAADSSSSSSLSEVELDNKKSVKKDRDNRIYSDTDSDAEVVSLETIKPKLQALKPKIYSDSEDENETPKLSVVEPVVKKVVKEKTPEPIKSLKPPTPEPELTELTDEEISKPPRTPGRESPDKTLSRLDRLYSDSDEEREKIQEKIRRNTEWMEQIEREAQEELARKKLEKPVEAKVVVSPEPIKKPIIHPKLNVLSQNSISSNNTSFGEEPYTPTSSLPPPTPGANVNTDPMEKFSKVKENKRKAATGKPRGRPPKAEKLPHEFNNGTTVPPLNNLSKKEQKLQLEKEQELQDALKLSPSSSDGGSSQNSQASLVAIDHPYSLPPSTSPSSSSSTPSQEQHRYLLDHDHGYGRPEPIPIVPALPAITHEVSATGSRPVGRPRKDPNAPKAPYIKKDGKESKESKKERAAALVLQQLSASHQTSESNYQKQFLEHQEQQLKQYQPPKPKDKAQSRPVEIYRRENEPFTPTKKYPQRDYDEEIKLLFHFLYNGVDAEDIEFLRRSYLQMLQSDSDSYWLNATHWVDHVVTNRSHLPPPAKKRRKDQLPDLKLHDTGSARTEGYYKIDSRVKANFKYHHLRGTAAGSHLDKSALTGVQRAAVSKMQNASREARSNQRRLLTAFGGATESDLLKFNQLKFRKKQLKFAKSAIHDWGLFSMEPIAADEMVIEYVGQMVRPSVADSREAKYEAIGIGSSYLFRIDLETIIDATKCGNLARFINHSCNVSILKFYLPF